MQPESNKILSSLPLGKTTEYVDQYQPNLLQAVPRSLARDELGISNKLCFHGVDIWNGYEISWLNDKGKPIVAIGEFRVPYDSPNLIESKSFKLYLNSFNQSQFPNWQQVSKLMTKDLSRCAGKAVEVTLLPVNKPKPINDLPGICIDDLDIAISSYQLNTSFLMQNSAGSKHEIIHSNLLKSNCLITNQPDWASIVIEYRGNAIDHAGLLKYLISFRQHNEFHEQCVERIFNDINKLCSPRELSVQAFYTRRGGLDINPYRTNSSHSARILRANRQ